jgi:hypothetical protein
MGNSSDSEDERGSANCEPSGNHGHYDSAGKTRKTAIARASRENDIRPIHYTLGALWTSRRLQVTENVHLLKDRKCIRLVLTKQLKRGKFTYVISPAFKYTLLTNFAILRIFKAHVGRVNIFTLLINERFQVGQEVQLLHSTTVYQKCLSFTGQRVESPPGKLARNLVLSTFPHHRASCWHNNGLGDCENGAIC